MLSRKKSILKKNSFRILPVKTTECKHKHEHSWDAVILKSVIPISTKKIIATCIVIAFMERFQVDNNSPYVRIENLSAC
jgi:hypothetical protein